MKRGRAIDITFLPQLAYFNIVDELMSYAPQLTRGDQKTIPPFVSRLCARPFDDVMGECRRIIKNTILFSAAADGGIADQSSYARRR